MLSPVVAQYLIYGGLVMGGWLLRHWGVSLPGLSTLPKTPAAPTSPALPSNGAGGPLLDHFPRLKALLDDLGPTGKGLLEQAFADGLKELEARLAAPQAPEKK